MRRARRTFRYSGRDRRLADETVCPTHGVSFSENAETPEAEGRSPIGRRLTICPLGRHCLQAWVGIWQPGREAPHVHQSPNTKETRFLKRLHVTLLALNLTAAVIYLHRASYGWRIPQEQELGLDSITAEPYIWFAAVLPVVAIFLVLNLAWGVLILRNRQWRSGRLWLVAALIWIVAIAVDFAHH
jgi:hypothetical protein